jgi:ankyrin repeat protein
MLIERGADVTAQNDDGETPLHLASAPTFRAQTFSQKYADVAHILLEHGADANARNKNGLTPFFLALQGGLAEVIHVFFHSAGSRAHDNAD